MNKSLLVAALVCASGFATAGDLPNPKMTPGALNPDITQANIHQTVCVKGFTKTIRPPAYYTNKLKKQQIRAYGYQDTNPRDYQEDHLVALSIGGAPWDERNLWPQPRKSEWGADKKDQLEFVLFKMLCANEISLQDARYAMAKDWINAWKRFVPSHSSHRFHSVD